MKGSLLGKVLIRFALEGGNCIGILEMGDKSQDGMEAKMEKEHVTRVKACL